MQTLVLIPDSTRKAAGRAPSASTPSILAFLPKKEAASLAGLRVTVAKAAKLPPGTDLDPGIRGEADVMPAYLRYQGNMYRRIPRDVWEKRAEGVEVLIISALYGLVASRDPIRMYDFSMAENLQGLGILNAWWRANGLASFLATAVRGMKAERVVDLLSVEYRKAVESYRQTIDAPVDAIDFPGMGRGSQPRRGEVLAEILRGKR